MKIRTESNEEEFVPEEYDEDDDDEDEDLETREPKDSIELLLED